MKKMQHLFNQLALGAGIALTATLGADTADAATILATDFNTVTTTNGATTASDIVWNTVNGIDTPGTSLTIQDVLPEINTNHNSDFHADSGELNVQRNHINEGDWFTTIEDVAIAAGTASIDLTSLSISLNATINGGTPQSGSKVVGIDVEVFNSSAASLGSASASLSDPGGGTGTLVTVDLTGLSSLTAGDTYDIVLTIFTPTTTEGQNTSADNLTLNGDITPVPEPGSLALLGLGGLLIVRRRRG